jgi:hypothetical protein
MMWISRLAGGGWQLLGSVSACAGCANKSRCTAESAINIRQQRLSSTATCGQMQAIDEHKRRRRRHYLRRKQSQPRCTKQVLCIKTCRGDKTNRSPESTTESGEIHEKIGKIGIIILYAFQEETRSLSSGAAKQEALPGKKNAKQFIYWCCSLRCI